MLSIACPKCQKTYRVREERAGQKARCSQCKEAMVIPIPELTDEPAPSPTRKRKSIPGHWIVAGTILFVASIAGGFYVWQGSEYERGRAAVREHQRQEDEKMKKIQDEAEWQRQVQISQQHLREHPLTQQEKDALGRGEDPFEKK
jgi:cytochrome c-type biogenesis protein CcmH/NrfG